MAGLNKKNYTWILKRYIVEEFQVTAPTKEDAKFLVEDPYKITVIKETIIKSKN